MGLLMDRPCQLCLFLSVTIYLSIFILHVCGDGSFRAEVLEESPVGTIIHGVAEYLKELNSGANVQYQLLGDEGVSRLVNLNPTTGQLRVRARVDREALCPSTDGNTNPNSMISVSGNADLFSNPRVLTSKLDSAQELVECVQTLNILLVSRGKDSSNPSGAPVSSMETSSRTSRILINLVIRDINDNAPMWTQGGQLEIGFVETPNVGIGWNPLGGGSVSASSTGSNTADGTAVKNTRTIDRAVDPDLGLNSTIVYRLLGPGAEYFRLDDGSQTSLTNADLSNKLSGYLPHSANSITRTNPLQIRPIMPLDRETEDFAGRGGLFNLTLLATDLGLPPKTGSITLLIHVIDVNDHAPVFHNELYQHSNLGVLGHLNRPETGLVVYRPSSGTIRETVPVGSLVIQLNATDKDVGAHAKLVYEFCPCDRSTAMGYFKVDRDSGRISVIKKLDYDLGPRQFQFKVIAKDSAPEPYTLTGTAMVEITLTDENDEAPMIHVMLVRPSSGGEMRKVLTSATDSTYQASVGSGAVFMGEYTTSINENPQPESIIAYIQVTDRDHHGQDQVHCRLGPTDNFTLQLDPVGAQYAAAATQLNYATGLTDGSNGLNRQDFRLVTGTELGGYSNTYNPLDREVTPVQHVTITCTDSVGNAAYVLIHVNLLDINDHEPEFLNGGQFTFQLAENEELNDGKPLWLGRTMATDKDVGENALITYQLKHDETGLELNGVGEGIGFESYPSRLFELDSQTGNLYTKTVFDRETAPSGGVYRLRVLAIDHGTPRLTGTATVEVFILDMNDWPPQFTKDVYTFSVPEDARIQEVIGTVEAIDRDADSQGKITYHLVPHTRQKRSVGNSISNKVYPSRTIRQTSSAPSSLEAREGVIAEDTDSPSTLNGTAEKLSTGSEPNPDRINNPESGVYFIPVNLERNNPGYFSVDRLTGKIRLIRRLDRESIAFFSLEIVAIDAPPISVLPVQHQAFGSSTDARNHTAVTRTQPGPQSLSTTTTVVIAITDVNDNAPVFRRPNTSTAIQLRLHETLGRQLLIMEAVDADEGENARVTYHIRSEVPRPPGGPGTGFFAVDETSGVLFLAKTLNSSTTHRLVVEACDNGSGATRRCTLSPSIRITVSDQDNPSADSTLYQARSSGVGGSAELPFDLDTVTVQRANPTVQAGRRNELVIVCLVVVFSVLLLATIILVACLVHRRGARTWFMGRLNGSNPDVPSYAKETISPKPNATGRMSTEPWLDDNSHPDQADLVLDTKFEACKSAQYDQPNDMKYLGRENLMTGAAYPIPSTGYLPHSNAVKLFAGPAISGSTGDGQTMPLTTQMAPMRFRPLHSPPVDYMTNMLDMHGAMGMPRSQHNSEISELLTQSSYKPPSPDYQSLDVMWHRVPRPDLGHVNQMTRYRNPIPNQTTAYAMGHGNSVTYTGPDTVTRMERGLFFSPIPNEIPRTSDAAHTYYEITATHQAQQPAQQTHRTRGVNVMDTGERGNLEDWTGVQKGSDKGTKSYTSAATLGRPSTGKGKRRSSAKGDSMHNPKAGELALHLNKKLAAGVEVNCEIGGSDENPEEAELRNQKRNTGTESVTYGTKPSGQYTYQAYREGTFV